MQNCNAMLLFLTLSGSHIMPFRLIHYVVEPSNLTSPGLSRDNTHRVCFVLSVLLRPVARRGCRARSQAYILQQAQQAAGARTDKGGGNFGRSGGSCKQQDGQSHSGKTCRFYAPVASFLTPARSAGVASDYFDNPLQKWNSRGGGTRVSSLPAVC